MALTRTQQNVRDELRELADWWLGPLATGDLVQDLYNIRTVRENFDATPNMRVGPSTVNAFERFRDLVLRAGLDRQTEHDLTGNWFQAKQQARMREARSRMFDGIRELVAEAKNLEDRIANNRNMTERQSANLARQHTELVGRLSRVASDPFERYDLRDMSAAAGLEFDQAETGATRTSTGGTDSRRGADRRTADPATGAGSSGGMPPGAGDPLDVRFGGGADAGAPGASRAAGDGGAGASEAGGMPPGGGGALGDGADTRFPIPQGYETWNVEGTYYLAYAIPDTTIKMVWQIEDVDRLRAIFGTTTPPADRKMSEAEFRANAPWKGGLSRELSANHPGDNPFQQWWSDTNEAAELRPWILDPSYLGVTANAYLEGRDVTTDELARTDWWNEHTEDERAWMESSATAGRAEVQRRLDDSMRIISESLRDAGMADAPGSLAGYIATQRLTGRWSEDYTKAQIRRITDPFAPGDLDRGIVAVLRDPDVGNAGDVRAISEGYESVRNRIGQIFTNARVPVATDQESERERLDRITREILTGLRSLDEVRRSVDQIALTTRGARPGGLDVTTEGEDRVRALVREWVGPSVAAGYSDQWVAEQAGRIRNDPDAEAALIEKLKDARVAAFGAWRDRDQSYESIAPVARSMYARIWGTSPDETDSLFLDVVNMTDQSEAAKRLRAEGRKRGITKVVRDSLDGLGQTPLGQQVVRSSV